MKKTPAWRRYLTFWRNDVVDDVDDELRFHVEMRVAEYMTRGMAEAEARGAVAERLGDVDAARAQCIEQGKLREVHARNADFVDSLRSDIRYALHSLGRAPGWTAVALLTIALGIGATTAVFRVADTLLLRPIPYRDASRVFVFRRLYNVGLNRQMSAPFSLEVVRAFREHAHSLEAAAPFRAERDQLTAGADSILVEAAMIDTAFLPLAGVHPLIGRNFTAAEVAPHGPSVMLLGEDLWRSQYGAARDVIGKVVQFSGQSTTIIGVVPASLTLPELRRGRAEAWVPFQEDLVDAVAVRLKPGVSRDAATQELAAIVKRSADDKPWWRDIRYDIRLVRPQDLLDFRQALAMLTGAVALLLLVACTNVGHLLLARGAARQRELAIRQALGAGRKRLVRQLVTEVLVIAVIGGALAMPVAWAALHLLQALRPESLVALSYVQNDRVITMSAVLAIAAGLAIGVGSALRSARRDLSLALRANASTAPTGRRLRGALVVGEIALSATLLVGALLLIHALYDLERKRLGFDATGLYSITFRPDTPGPAVSATVLGELIRQRAKGIPGMEGSAVAVSGGAAFATFETSRRAALDNAPRATGISAIGPEYFSMMGMPLVAGRTFDDGSLGRNEVIVNTTLARMLVPDGSPLGIRFRNARPIRFAKDWLTVIGVVPDVVDNLLGVPQPQIYAPIGNPNAIGPLTLYVRLRGEPSPESLTRFAASVQPSGTKPVIASVRQKIDESAAEPRFAMRVMTIFAALGVLLASIGLFGVVSYSVGQRTREIGVRMTLGATRGAIARLVVSDGIRLALLGIVVGLAGAVTGTRLIQSMLFGVSRVDPFAFGAGAVLLLAVAVVACVVPMWRATGVDPVVAVRAE
jgi:putative ABC transport system permease protein